MITVILVWQSTIRHQSISSSKARILLVALLIGIIGAGLDYRSGRPDALMALLYSIAFWGCSLQSLSIRFFLLIAIGVLIPWSGLANIAYAVTITSLLILFFRLRFLKEIFSLMVGIFIGSILLYLFYQYFGVWDKFILSLVNNPSIVKRAGFITTDLRSLNRDGLAYSGYRALSLLAILLFARRVFSKNLNLLSIFSVASMIYIPLVMIIAGAYPRYYAWMACIPLVICICAELSRL